MQGRHGEAKAFAFGLQARKNLDMWVDVHGKAWQGDWSSFVLELL